MKWSLGLRALVYLRRLTRAAESIARSQSTLARDADATWNRAHRPRGKSVVHFDQFDVDAANAQWRADREAEMISSEDDG